MREYLFRVTPLLLVATLCSLLPLAAMADVAILAYHHVSSETPPSTSTTPDLFKKQLQTIEQLDMEVVSLSKEMTGQALSGDQDERLRTALTFDDAYASVYTRAWPILRKQGIPFTIFVTTDAIDDGIEGYMTWEQIRELAEHDLVTIGNHTSDHASLLRRPDESEADHAGRVAASLDGGAERLEEELGSEPQLFAHPYGEFSETVDRALEERRWYGFGQHSGVLGPGSSPYAIPRFPVANAYGGTDTLKDKLRARNFPISRTQALPSPVLGEQNPPVLKLPLPETWDAERLTCFAPGEGRIEIELAQHEPQRIAKTQATKVLKARRSRYNCTYPASEGRFYWLSQPWFNREAPEG